MRPGQPCLDGQGATPVPTGPGARLAVFPTRPSPNSRYARGRDRRTMADEKEISMAQPQQHVFHALDQALAAAVATAAPAVIHVARGHGHAGTGIAWSDDLVISASFHTPDRTHIGVP